MDVALGSRERQRVAKRGNLIREGWRPKSSSVAFTGGRRHDVRRTSARANLKFRQAADINLELRTSWRARTCAART